jgi:hypothetical protein
MSRFTKRPVPGTVIATVAWFVALGGVAAALPGKNSVDNGARAVASARPVPSSDPASDALGAPAAAARLGNHVRDGRCDQRRGEPAYRGAAAAANTVAEASERRE